MMKSKSRLAALLIAGAVAIGACTGETTTQPNITSVSAAFDNPPAYPGYQWMRNGKPVRPEELGTSAGPPHCGWQSATFLTVGWPLGTVSQNIGQTRSYIRDPWGVIGGTYRERLATRATVPLDARATGYRLGAIELYLSPSDQDKAAYLVTSAGAERWPRADPFVACQ